jgi:transcriptional regulator with XRE-family HTH domain
MRINEPQLTSEEWEARVGAQFRALRLAAGIDQLALAERAAVSVGALRNLERGTGSTLRTVVQVSRALGNESWLASLAPTPTISPIDAVRSRHTPRSRVYRARGAGASGGRE